MATAPVLVLLYDRTSSPDPSGRAEAARLYSERVACTWVVLAVLLAGTGSRGGTADSAGAISWPVYALTQFRRSPTTVAVGLARPLVFFYGSPSARPPGQLLATSWSCRGWPSLNLRAGGPVAAGLRRRGIFLILAPSSSWCRWRPRRLPSTGCTFRWRPVVVAGAPGAQNGRSARSRPVLPAAGRAFLVVGPGRGRLARDLDAEGAQQGLYARGDDPCWRATVDRVPLARDRPVQPALM